MVDSTNIVIPESMWTTVREHVFRDAPKEGLAFLCCQEGRGQRGRHLLARRLVLPRSGDLDVQSPGGVTATGAFLKRVVAYCAEGRQHLVPIHSHPFAQNGRFSAIDDHWEHDLATYLSAKVPRMVYASIVLGHEGGEGRVFVPETSRFESVADIKVVGNGIRWIDAVPSSGHGEDNAADRYDRQRLVFGEDGQRRLRSMTVAVVGVGGTGAHVAQQLAHLGVGTLILTDPDRVETSNLNRLIGATPRDAQRQRPKVDVVRRLIRRIAPWARVVALRQPVERCARYLKDADVVFSCVDRERPRFLLMRFPAQYYIPVVDLATGLTAREGAVAEVYGQVRLVLPGGPCFRCSGSLDTARLRAEGLSADEREAERRHGYGLGPDVPAPGVVSLNGTLASLAVTEFINLIGPFRDPIPYLFYDGGHADRVAHSIAVEKSEDCPVCGWDVLGAGDTKPLPRFGRKRAPLPDRKEPDDVSE